MNIIGKILFFNANDGQGIIITSKKKKINFSVTDWDDFDTMPSLGLEVRFDYDDSVVSSIVSVNYVEDEDEDEDEKPEEKLQDEPVNKTEEEKPQEVAPEPQDEDIDNNDDLTDDSEPQDESSKEENETEKDENSTDHFESDDGIAELGTNEELEEEIGEREESVTVSMNLPMAVSNYFNIIDENIQKRASYKKVEGRLDYLVIRRFLWTTFNNLSEIDLHIITPKIRALSDDLKAMSVIYDDFARKTKYPKLAYEEVFLSCQAEYKKVREGAEKIIQRLNQLRGSEKHLGGVLKIKKEELSKEIVSDEFEVLKDEMKSLNGAYVDVVHMMAELDERYKHDMKLLVEFEKEYREDFYDLFGEAAKKYKVDIITILSAQAYVLDSHLWQQAKVSKAVKVHFHKSGISGEFNTRTYLKYYLDTQDSNKASGDNKKLFELYEYLVAQQKEHIMVVLSDVNDALELEACIQKMDKTYEAKAFLDEKLALKWAIKNSVQVLILETELARMRVETFLNYYKKYVLVIPKIILLGHNKNSDEYTIHKLLSRGTSSLRIAQNVKELLSSEKEKE